MKQWTDQALGGVIPGQEIVRVDSEGFSRSFATAYELSRIQQISIPQRELTWTERVLLVHSEIYHLQQQRGLEQRLATATEKLFALTPSPGRGKRQIRDSQTLHLKAQGILKTHRVEGLLDYSYEYQAPALPQKERYQITAVTPNPQAIEQETRGFGWRADLTNAPSAKLSLSQAILAYRDEWIAERNFGRFKGVPLSITPFFVQRDDQVTGLVHLLSLAVRLLSLIEFVVRRRLQQTGQSLSGLYPGNPTRTTARPTTEKLLQAFNNLTLTLLQVRGECYGDITPLNPLQLKILNLLGLSPEIYSGLVENST
jgi:transposase